MPGIVALGRRWSVGSDDFVIPAILLLITNLIWGFILLTYGIEFVAETYYLTGRRRFIVGMTIYIILLILCIIIEAVIIYYSLRGSILNPAPREPTIVYLMYIRLVLFVLQLLCSFIGLYFAWSFDVRMTGTKRIIGLIVWELILLLLLIWFMYDSAGDKWVDWKEHKRQEEFGTVKDAYMQAWNRRCRRLCCCIDFNATSAAQLQEVTKIFAELFIGEDVVPTDILTAMVLIDQRRKYTESQIVQQPNSGIAEFCSGVPITSDTKFYDFTRTENVQTFIDMHHFMHYAWASYGYFYYLTTSCGCGRCCNWMCGLNCCACCCCPTPGKQRDFALEGADCGMANTSAILNSFPPDCDAKLFYISYLNAVGETPFFIVLDHTKRAVVIIPRGTMSFDDAVTDAMMEPVQIPLKEPKQTWQAHSGMTTAGKYMYDKIIAENLVPRAQAERKGDEEYKIIVCGHSLGAGTAPLLATLLHQDYPGLQCYAFSPPGGLMSRAAIAGTRDFITTIVIGDDMVPRIGVNQLNKLRKDVVDVLTRVDKPKYSILCGSVFGYNSYAACQKSQDSSVATHNTVVSSGGDVELADISLTTQLSPSAQESNNTHTVPDKWKGLLKQMSIKQKLYPSLKQETDGAGGAPELVGVFEELFLPGNVLHIVKSDADKQYKAIWAQNDSFQFIIVEIDMLMDHRGDTVLKVMDGLIEKHKNEPVDI